MGYFPGLYRRVTLTVRDAIEAGRFEDNERMEALDIHFAGRYIEAWEQIRRTEPPTDSWKAAFDGCADRRLIVLQHLLLGMNAHISLDLGISAAAVADPGRPLALKRDFMSINAILGDMIDDTQRRLTRFFVPLWFLDNLLGPADESLSLFSIEYARDKAWTQTLELICATDEERQALVLERDRKVAGFSSRLVRPPKWWMRLLLRTVRFMEKGDVAWRIGVLNEVAGADSIPL